MATEILSGPLGEIRAVSTADGGTALSGTPARVVLPLGTKWVSLTPRNFATAVVAQFNFNPWITVIKTTDLLATQANITDYSENAQDGSAATDVTLSSLTTFALLSAVYVGSHLPFSGLEVDVDATNGTASVLSGTYWNGSTWANITLTDGTASGGATFAQDGNITWTVPTAWETSGLVDSVATAERGIGVTTAELYWVRLVVSAALDSSTTLNSMIAINRNTALAELVDGQVFEQAVTVGPGGIASLTASVDAGTANLIINAATRQGGRFA